MTPSESGGVTELSTPLSNVEALLVDDDETWARTQRRILERCDGTLTVSTASSLREARIALESSSPDCLICDYQLGDGTGLELLEEVRSERPNVPFVLVTGQGDETVASEAISGQVTDYVRKDDLASQPALLARRVESVVVSYRTGRALERERRSKNVLLDAVTASTSRRELGRRVCEHLVDEHRYACAWIGVLDRDGTIVPLARAGTTAYVETALEPGTEPGAGTEPAVDALARGEAVAVDRIRPEATSSDGGDDARGETAGQHERDVTRWERAALECGFRSAAAVPIDHDDVQFGVLAVYDTDHDRFDRRTLGLLRDHATTIGYALQAAEWRRTLLSSTVTNVEITIADETAPLSALSGALPEGTTVDVTTVIPRNDDEVLYLASVSGASSQAVVDAGEMTGSVRSVETYGTDGTTRFGFVVQTPVPEAILVESGSRFERTVAVDGRTRISAEIPAAESIRDTVGRLEEAFDDTTVTTVWSDPTGRHGRGERGLERLTERQRQVLELAADAGYFERPREHNTGELAEMLDISRATFTQHLRAAQSKLFEDILAE
ncbi:bacterio-opsin activator domain-containing protein [Natrarchaeobius sp. A-rgal3]|uniref:bacterio-opsin activator domain-containing protein n=1 Tax=Natrarchaeobius versutus TaxID=1679078 RepID=UPI00350F67DC